MTKSRKFASIAFASALALGTTTMAPPASAQSSGSTLVPVALWAATGAVIGAVAWPYIVGTSVATATATAAAPGAMAAPGAAVAEGGIMSWSTFLNTGAAAGAVLGGVGYLMTR